MLKYFANTPPSVHLLLLILIPLLRWPAFLAGYYHADESLSLLVAERAMVQGPLYVGAWYAGPPLHIWFYEVFMWLFGRGAMTGMRLFTLLWVYLIAIYFNGVVGRFRVLRRYEGLPGILLAVLASMPWSSLYMSSELLAMWPILVAFNGLLSLSEVPARNYGLMFQSGALLTLAALINYKAVFLLAGGALAYLILRTARLDELMAGLGGIIVVLLGLMGILFLQGNLRAFEEIGVSYYFQRLGVTGTAFYPLTSQSTLLSLASTWGLITILTIVGFVHFRLRFFSYVVKIRSLEIAMALWLVAGLVMLLAKWRRLDPSDVHLLLPPVAFYAALTLTFSWPQRLRILLLPTGMGLLLLSYLSGWSLRFPETMSWLQPDQPPTWLYGSPQRGAPLPATLAHSLDAAQAAKGIWIMAYQPHWYLALDAPCVNRYVDFRLAYYKFSVLPGYQQEIARPEAEADIFRAFAQQPPSYVIDPQGWFPLMQERYPSLFADYRAQRSGQIVVYSRQQGPPVSAIPSP
jgi:hypothetical protein